MCFGSAGLSVTPEIARRRQGLNKQALENLLIELLENSVLHTQGKNSSIIDMNMNVKLTAEETFYAECLKVLKKTGIPFMVGGTYAVNAYLGLDRPTKDMDIFCKTVDFPSIIRVFADLGYQTSVEDERWLAKVKKGPYFLDLVFSMTNRLSPITEDWFKNLHKGRILGLEVSLLSPTELLVSKMFIQDRYKYEGSDVAHLILIEHKNINWKRLVGELEPYWEVLLIHALNFRFIYPSERELIPRWLIDDLLSRLKQQMETPTSKVKICRGKLFSPGDYSIDIEKWGFTDIIGKANEYKKQ